MKNHNIYLYGMVLRTHAFLLKDRFPQPDTYNELKEKLSFTGGETGMAATVLASLGCRVKVDGNDQGINTGDMIRAFYAKIGVDCSRLRTVPDYDGVEDYVIVDSQNDTRTNFGQFAAYFADYYRDGIARWNTPVEEDIIGVKAAGIDPFFDKQSLLAAKLCRKHNVPFATIDEKPDKEICGAASIIAVSNEFIRDHMPEFQGGEGKARLMKKYAEYTDALVILTGGGGTTFYGRNGHIHPFQAYKVKAISTLGAGDTFKAGCVYSLMQGYDDEKTVQFASACAAVACTKFPLAYNPPTLEEITRLFNQA